MTILYDVHELSGQPAIIPEKISSKAAEMWNALVNMMYSHMLRKKVKRRFFYVCRENRWPEEFRNS
jgi:hypothetical protein